MLPSWDEKVLRNHFKLVDRSNAFFINFIHRSTIEVAIPFYMCD